MGELKYSVVVFETLRESYMKPVSNCKNMKSLFSENYVSWHGRVITWSTTESADCSLLVSI